MARRFSVERLDDPREGVVIGAITVLTWIVVISFSVWAGSLNRETDDLFKQSRDVESSLRRLP